MRSTVLSVSFLAILVALHRTMRTAHETSKTQTLRNKAIVFGPHFSLLVVSSCLDEGNFTLRFV